MGNLVVSIGWRKSKIAKTVLTGNPRWQLRLPSWKSVLNVLLNRKASWLKTCLGTQMSDTWPFWPSCLTSAQNKTSCYSYSSHEINKPNFLSGWILTKFSWIYNWDITKNWPDFNALDLIFKATEWEKLKIHGWGTSVFSENTVTSFCCFCIKTWVLILMFLCKNNKTILINYLSYLLSLEVWA